MGMRADSFLHLATKKYPLRLGACRDHALGRSGGLVPKFEGRALGVRSACMPCGLDLCYKPDSGLLFKPGVPIFLASG